MASAEQIYSASTNEDVSQSRLAERLARRIEDDIVADNVPTGGIVGSLRDLSERYTVGRAAAREAVALLERRGLGRLRPGPCGGFIVARPAAIFVSAELANYFRLAEVTPSQVWDACEAVDRTAAEVTIDGGHLAEILEFVATPRYAGVLAWNRHLREIIGRRSGEPAIDLFACCLNDLTGSFAEADQNSECERAVEVEIGRVGDALKAGGVEPVAEAVARIDVLLGETGHDHDLRLGLPDIDTARSTDDRTLASLVARRISAEIVSGPGSGQRLGSEWDLCEKFSVSRATLRQAIRQLQDSGLVECRRGRGNGLLARNPRGTGGIRLVLAYLMSRQMDPLNAGTLLFQLNRYVPALAISRASPEQRSQLEKLLGRVRHRSTIDRYDLLKLVQHVSQTANSPIIDLFSRCLAAYEARFHPQLMERLPASIQLDYFDLLASLLANYDGDEPEALEQAKQQSAAVLLEMSRTRPI